MAPIKLFHCGQLKAAVYAFQELYILILQAMEFELYFDICCC